MTAEASSASLVRKDRSIGARRRSRRARALVVAAAALLVLVAVSDVVAARLIGSRIAGRARCTLVADRVGASVTAWAPVDALSRGELGTVRLTATGVHRNGLILDLTAQLRGVTTAGEVASSSDHVLVGYGAAARHGAAPGGPGGGGGGSAHVSSVTGDGRHLLIGLDVGALGSTATLVAAVSTDGSGLTVTPTSLEVMGRTLSVGEIEPLLAARNPTLAVQLRPRRRAFAGLPQGARVDDVRPDPNGLAILLSTGRLTAASLRGPMCSVATPSAAADG